MKPHHTGVVLLGAASFLLGGCAWSPAHDSWPLPPEDVVGYEPPVLAPNPGTYEQMSIAQKHAEALRKRINKHSLDRGRLDWATGDYTSIGAIAAVGGAVAGQPGLMNTGAGLSLLGIAASDRYQYNIQYASYAGARKALECMLTHAQTTNDKEVLWGTIQQGSKETQEAASALPTGMVQATLKVKEGLITRLQSIENEPVKAGDFRAVVKEQQLALANEETAEADLTSKVTNESTSVAGFSMRGAKKLNAAQEATKKRIAYEQTLVPLERQVEVGKKLVMLLPAINTCVAGY